VAKLPTFKLVLTDELRASLEALAEQEGLSLAELMRRRLQESIEPDHSPATRQFQSRIKMLAGLVQASTGWHFARHPAAAETLRRAISILLERYGARPDAKFAEDEMTSGLRLVPGADPATIAAGLETIVSAGPAALAGSLVGALLSDKVITHFASHYDLDVLRDEVRRRAKDYEIKESTINSLELYLKLIAQQKELIAKEGEKDEKATKSPRRRMRKSERE
jgi:hypothetical protein